MSSKFFIIEESEDGDAHDTEYLAPRFSSFEAAIQGTRATQVLATEGKDIWRLSDGRFVKMRKGLDPVRLARLVVDEQLSVFAPYKDWLRLDALVDDFLDYNRLRWQVEFMPGKKVKIDGKEISTETFLKRVREEVFGKDFDPYEVFDDFRTRKAPINDSFFDRFRFESVPKERYK